MTLDKLIAGLVVVFVLAAGVALGAFGLSAMGIHPLDDLSEAAEEAKLSPELRKYRECVETGEGLLFHPRRSNGRLETMCWEGAFLT